MDKLQVLLDSGYKPDVYVLESDLAVDIIRHMIEQAGYNFFYLDGKRIVSEQDFFQEAQQALAFPYFGQNWDAFDDCVSDMSWVPLAKGNVILYDEFEQFAQNDLNGFKLAFHGLQYATRVDITPQPTYVLLRGDRSFLPEVSIFGDSEGVDQS